MIGLILAMLFLASCLYAIALQTRTGRHVAARRTWVTVVLGVAMVLGALFPILQFNDWLIVIGAFAAAGAPIVARSIYNELRDEIEAMKEFRE